MRGHSPSPLCEVGARNAGPVGHGVQSRPRPPPPARGFSILGVATVWRDRFRGAWASRRCESRTVGVLAKKQEREMQNSASLLRRAAMHIANARLGRVVMQPSNIAYDNAESEGDSHGLPAISSLRAAYEIQARFVDLKGFTQAQ